MSVLEGILIVLAGVGAGTINTIVGSGTLITFPTLLLFGVPAVTANVSNNIGLVPGGLTGAIGYRTELVGARRAMLRLAPMSFLGGITGALLLLKLPAAAFDTIVPVLILVGIALVLLGPRLSASAAAHHHDETTRWRTVLLQAGVFGAGMYGGYFGAAQGVILMGIMGALSAEPLQRLNGYKNVLATIVNAVAAAVFMLVAWDRIDWRVVLLIAVGATIGGVIGSTIGRRLSPTVLRAVIVTIGVVAIVRLVWFR